MRNYHLYLCIFSAVVGLGGCASGMQPSTDYMDPDGTILSVAGSGPLHNTSIVHVIHGEQFSNVLLVTREPGSQPNAHPLAITADTVANLLAKINLRKSAGSKNVEPLFSADEVKELAPWLATGLVTATPDQEVVFSYPQSQGLGLFTLKYLTTGRVFYRDGRLNIIFGVVRAPYEAQYLQTGRIQPYAVGSRSVSTMANRQDEQLVTDEQVLAGAPSRIDWITLALNTSAPQPPAAGTAQGSAVQNGQGIMPPTTVEDRLTALKKLHDTGLITDQEYNDKRKQILDGL